MGRFFAVMLAGDMQHEHYVRGKNHEHDSCKYKKTFSSYVSHIITPIKPPFKNRLFTINSINYFYYI